MKRLIAFDLDGTLAPSKSALPDRVAAAVGRLLEHHEVCIISGGKFSQFETQFLNNFQINQPLFHRLHLMPTCGTQYYAYDLQAKAWKQIYAENLNKDDKERIIDTIHNAIRTLGLRQKSVYGEIIEDRGSQITFSALGQDIVAHLGDEGVAKKEAWDPDSSKKNKLRQYLADRLPDFEVRTGGSTSIDITRPGIDKAYGMNKLMEHLRFSKSDILFIGDRLEEGGNDYPVLAMGIDSIQIAHWQETALVVEAINLVA